MAERDLVQVEALNTFRTTGLPDSSYTHFDAPLVEKGTQLWVTVAQREYLKTMVKEVGGEDPTREDFNEKAESFNTPYARQPSPYPHLYVPGKSTLTPPTALAVEGRLDATTETVTYKQDGSPFGTGHADHPELYERQPTVEEADAEETQRSLRTKDAPPATS